MNHNPIIFMDVDNTLIASLDVLSERNKEALLRYCRAGGRIVFATGKVPSALDSLLALLDLENSWQIAGNGAILFNSHKGEIRTITKVGARSKKCIEALKKIKIPFYVYTAHKILKDFDEDYSEHIEHFRMLQEPDPQKTDFFDDEEVLKILMFIDVTDVELMKVVKEGLSDCLKGLHLVRTSNYLVEIHAEDQMKSTAIKELAKLENLDLNQAYAIGDSENDLPMLDIVGHPYVVANASKEIQARGYSILPSCKENGVATLLDSLIKEVHK